MSFSLFLSGISLGRYCRKSLAKSVGFRKNIKRGNSHVWGLSIEGGFKPAHCDIERLKGNLRLLNSWGDLNWRGVADLKEVPQTMHN